MKLIAQIGFWENGVTCFCHEAIGRALHQAFPEIKIEDSDLAHEKYSSVANSNERLAASAWSEYLRNGPRYRFDLPSGVCGYFGRYSVEMIIPSQISDSEMQRIEAFLHSLSAREIQIQELH
jgi:hypothetical protein